MTTRTVAIGSAVGLHARPAALFVQAVTESGKKITIARPGDATAPANSILAVMAMGVQHGETIELASDDEGTDEVLDSLVELLAQDLDA
jgi:phosphocarrier protein